MVSGMDVLRERIARALWENRYPSYGRTEGPLWNLYLTDVDAVVAALGLTEYRVSELDPGDCTPHRRFMTPWERIEDDA